MRLVPLLCLTFAILLVAGCGRYVMPGDLAAGGCRDDMGCKGDRVCNSGRCVDAKSSRTLGQGQGVLSAASGEDCDAGDPEACYSLGMKFVYGAEGTRDVGQARAYFHKACRMGHVISCTNLSMLIEEKGPQRKGDSDSSKCLVHDVAVYEKACASGHGEACYNAARLHDGELLYKIPRNVDKAKKYYKKGCSVGHEKACKKVD